MTNKKNGTSAYPVLLIGLVCLLAGLRTDQTRAMDNNLQITGALVSEPCTLNVSDNTLSVEFGSVVEKTLYSDTRTHGVPFTVNLTDCDTSLGKLVNLTFSGAESTALPGLLDTTGDGSTGIAVGIETSEGVALPLNQPTQAFDLQDGTTAIVLQAYVQAEPETLSQHNLVPGDFSAVATIDASYP